MATHIIRLPETDSVQIPAPGDEIIWTESLLYTYSDPAVKSVWEVLADPIVPKQGQRYKVPTPPNPAPVDATHPAALIVRTTADWRSNFICRAIDASPVPQTPKAWHLRVRWSTRESMDDTRPYFNLTRSTGTRSIARFRGGDAIWNGVPDDGTITFPPTAWMQGTSVDTYGQPLAGRVAQQSIQVDFLWNRTLDSVTPVGGGTTSADPPSTWTSTYVNSRNSKPFLGWPIGYVTYLGWTANESPDETLVVSHRFLADDWQHLEQRVAPNKGGVPLLGTGPVLVNIPTDATANVYWYQPFERLEDFDLLFSWRAHLLEAINTPKPTYP
jgi:hypothetical protein